MVAIVFDHRSTDMLGIRFEQFNIDLWSHKFVKEFRNPDFENF